MQIVPKDYALELSIFAVQKLALHQNLVEILEGVRTLHTKKCMKAG